MNIDNKYIKVLQPKTKLFSEGDISQEIYILLEGEIEIIKDNKKLYSTKENGTFIGEMSAILNIPRSATAITKSTTKVIEIAPINFENIITHQPDIALKLIKLLASRLYDTTNKFSVLSSKEISTQKNDNDTTPILKILYNFYEINPNDIVTLILLAYSKYTKNKIDQTKRFLKQALDALENIE